MVKDANGERIVIPREHLYYTYENHEPRHDPIYVEERCLAQLLLDDVCFCNTGRFDEERTVVCFVACNDVFAWACADAEPVTLHEIPALYEAHMADPAWGAVKWVINRRGEMPQPPVLAAMKKAGAWDLDESAIGPNVTDAETQALFAQAAALGPAKETWRQSPAPTPLALPFV